MDDTAKPYDRTADESGTGPIPPEPSSASEAPSAPPEEDASRDPGPAALPDSAAILADDPFASFDPLAAAEEPPIDAAHPTLFDADEMDVPDEAPAATAGVEAGSAEDEDEYAEPAADLSLDEMVGELATDAESPLIPEVGATETGPETETTESAQDSEGAAEAGEEADEEAGEGAVDEDRARSWRDEAAETAAVPMLARDGLSARLPFWIYGGVWVLFVAVMTYLMWPLSVRPFVEETYYGYFILGGAGLLAVGPVVALGVWLSARMGASTVERAGLVRAVCMRAAGWMTIGVAAMWVSLYVLDLHRIGSI